MSRDRTVIIAAAVALVLGPLAAAWLMRPGSSASPCALTAGPAPLPELMESSGLAVSRRNPGLIWSHNDSGSAAVLFALDATTGVVRARVRVPIATRDWEDVSAGRCPSGDCLYIADIGDNKRDRPQVRIYRVPEPAEGDPGTAQPEVFTATYVDGPHNAEAMFVIDADLFIVIRDRTGGVYRATLTPGSHALIFKPVAQLRLEAVTDAETSPDRTTVVVRTSHEAVLYWAADLVRGIVTPYLRIPLDGLREPQGEGVAIDGKTLYLSSEGRALNQAGRFMSLRCELHGRPNQSSRSVHGRQPSSEQLWRTNWTVSSTYRLANSNGPWIVGDQNGASSLAIRSTWNTSGANCTSCITCPSACRRSAAILMTVSAH